MKLEKYLSRPDYEATFRSLRLFHEGLPQDGIGCPDAFPVELKTGDAAPRKLLSDEIAQIVPSIERRPATEKSESEEIKRKSEA